MALRENWNNSDILEWLEMKEMNRKFFSNETFSRNEFNDQICTTRRAFVFTRNSFEEDYLIAEWKFVIEFEWLKV